MALIPIYEVCGRDTGYKEEGRCREPWWQKTAAQKQLRAALEEIWVAARAQRRESGRCGKGKGREEAVEYKSGSEGSWYSGIDTRDT